jgi:hypothetical protein
VLRESFTQNVCTKMPTSTTTLLQGTLDVVVLKILALEPMHGLGISRWIAQVTHSSFQVKPGSLFPALHRSTRRFPKPFRSILFLPS